jgi:hypothetical protein
MMSNTASKKLSGVLFLLTFDSVLYQAEPHRPVERAQEDA